MKSSKNLKQTLIMAVLIFFAALIGQSTAYGYIHLADPLIIFTACLLPAPHALLAAGIASLLADLAKGYYLLAPVTLLIKLLMVLMVKGLLKIKRAHAYQEMLAASAALLPVAGYYIAETIHQFIIGKGASAFSIACITLKKDLIQAAGSILLFLLLYYAYKTIKTTKEATRQVEEQEKKEQESRETNENT